jgi:hypothetical protein
VVTPEIKAGITVMVWTAILWMTTFRRSPSWHASHADADVGAVHTITEYRNTRNTA